MRTLLLVFALLSIMAAPADALDITKYESWNRQYEELPGPMVYSPKEEPAWLASILGKIQSEGPPKTLHEHYLFRGPNGPSYLVTTGFEDEAGSILEIHRVVMDKAGNPSAVFVQGFRGDIVWVVVPTGHDVFGDGIPTLFMMASAGGSSDEDETVRIIRLGDSPTDVTPQDFGNVAEVAFPLAGGKGFLLLTRDMVHQSFYGTCGACYIVPQMLVEWRNGRYRPACRDYAEYYRAVMENRWRKNMKNYSFYPQGFVVARMGWIWDAIQVGDIATAMRMYKETIAEAYRRGTNWPFWEGRTPPTAEEYRAEIVGYENEFLPILREAKRHPKAQCPLTTGRPLSDLVEPFDVILPPP